ncbi:MAG: hypothetical protein WAU91_09195 [Desulfatitalea sp.]
MATIWSSARPSAVPKMVEGREQMDGAYTCSHHDGQKIEEDTIFIFTAADPYWLTM